MIVSQLDLMEAGRTIWGEARGEKIEGQQAVAWVILNRAKLADAYAQRHRKPHPLFGDGTLRGVVTARLQFSCRNADDPNYRRLISLPAEEVAPFMQIMRSVVEGHVSDQTLGATHYLNAALANPTWDDEATLTVTIGHHKFYKDVP